MLTSAAALAKAELMPAASLLAEAEAIAALAPSALPEIRSETMSTAAESCLSCRLYDVA